MQAGFLFLQMVKSGLELLQESCNLFLYSAALWSAITRKAFVLIPTLGNWQYAPSEKV